MLNGTVHAGDIWKLGIGNRDLQYAPTSTDDLAAVAQHLGSQLGAPYRFTVTTTARASELTITNAAGFSLNGATLSGLMQLVASANTVTRSTTVTQGDGATPVGFTTAHVTLQPTATAGDTWSITVGMTTGTTTSTFTAMHVYGSVTGDTLTNVANDLATQISTHFGAGTATALNGVITLNLASGASSFTVAFSIAGVSPSGSVTVDGTPLTAQLPATAWTSETLTIPTSAVRNGEMWHITLTDVGGANPHSFQAAATADGDASGLATLLKTAIDGHNGYTATASANVVTIHRATPFSSSGVTVDPAGTVTIDPSTYDTHQLTFTAAQGETGTWTVTLTDHTGGAVLFTGSYGAGTSDDANAIAGHFTTAIDGATFNVSRSGATLTITRLDTASDDFDTSVTFTPDAAIASQTTNVVVVTVPTPGADTFKLTVGTSTSSDISGTSAHDVASQLATFVRTLTGYTVNESAGVITIVSTTGATFAVMLKRTTQVDDGHGGTTPSTTDISSTAVDTSENGVVFTFTGPAVDGETWNAGGASYPVGSGGQLTDAIDGLQAQLNGGSRIAVRSGNLITVASASALSTAHSIGFVADFSVGATQATRIVTLGAPVSSGDVWTLVVAGDSTPAQVTVAASSATSADAVATSFSLSSAYPSGYTVVAAGSVLYVTSTGSTTFTLAKSISRSNTGTAAIGGTLPLAWTQTATIAPAGNPGIALGDSWSIIVSGVTYTAQVTATISNGWRFHVTGAGDVDITNKSSAAEFVAAAFDAAIGAPTGITAAVVNGKLVVTATDGTPLAVGMIMQARNGATFVPPSASGPTTTDPNVHYTQAIVDLLGDVTPVWQGGEMWTITVNGIAYTYTVPQSGVALGDQTLDTIAAGLALAFTNGAHDSALTAVANGATVTVTDNSVGHTHAFSISITRGGNGVKGIIDIDDANDVTSSVQVPVVLPQYQWIVALFPWAAQYFPVNDTLGFTATPDVPADRAGRARVLATVTCTIVPNSITGACASTPDAGSSQTSRSVPRVQLHAARHVHRQGRRARHVERRHRRAPGAEHVLHGRHLRRLDRDALHADGLAAASRRRTRTRSRSSASSITIIDGPGAGQTATITAYDSQTGTYTLDTKWATAAAAGSQFEISESTVGAARVHAGRRASTRSCSRAPRPQTVYVDVTPQPTPTYDSDAGVRPELELRPEQRRPGARPDAARPLPAHGRARRRRDVDDPAQRPAVLGADRPRR